MKKICIALLLGGAGTAVLAQDVSSKPASASTKAANRQIIDGLDMGDRRDETFSTRGFVATRTDPVIRAADGGVAWDLSRYDWVKGDAPDTVNASLWRQMKLLKAHGLYKLTEGVWQVRGFDISNMTVIKGRTGWILIDPLLGQETARAALDLVNANLGNRPVTAVIYTHSHGDHFGGVRGVVDEADVTAGKVAIVAPDRLIEEAIAENVIAGNAMGRRATYQFGSALTPGERGQMGSGIGPGTSAGGITLLAPTDLVKATGDTRTIDGVTFEFQMVPESEAPSEFNLYLPAQKALIIGEIAVPTLHNIQTPRGALVRDALKWAGYLTQAVRLYGDRSDVVAASHGWPRFGQNEVKQYLTLQRDNYKFLHDQSVRLMNAGLTAEEIAETITPPPVIARQWFNRGYYGTYSHNSKAVYHRYMGWYDGVPAHLDPLPPVEVGKRYVAAIGGQAQVLTLGRAAIRAGDYRWAGELLNHLVSAEPANGDARALLADAYEQLGYQAESAIWRNMYLMGALELRGKPDAPSRLQGLDLLRATPTPMLLDAIATRLNPAVIGDRAMTLNLVFTDRKERALISVRNAVLVPEMDQAEASPTATLTGPRALFLGLFFQKTPVAQLESAGLKVTGDKAAITALQAALQAPDPGFAIVTP
ncbi:alkyl/aryl-sulfatase [Sphingomonas cavernae]|uniref:MBL fold metallo-hydrolase n=1 Tax=Sphingomonas cavernae TaxID=2320861 RepID=A0A418WNU5_9SPHN|nr:alkyl sulfatase dimerization domain-containing protein [Sphingomonas cavernae]RJF92901.1 MBL fold metallo-hydrolase [Sphingomonas cavernae]